MAIKTVHWMETELSRHYENLDLSRGVDLDRNGAIEGAERTDRNGDGDVNSAEWKKFTGDNKAALEKLGGHFKTYYSAGSSFKPDNPIHDLLSIEADVASPEEVGTAYEKVEEILRNVEKRLSDAKLDPQEKLELVYYVMKQVGIKYKDQDDSSLVSNVNDGVLDCDTSSVIVLAVAFELGWPVYLVRAPRHVFVRWDDDAGTELNMDFGRTRTREYYMSEFDISQQAVESGVYMKGLDHRGMLSLFYANRALNRSDMGEYEEAIADFDKALDLASNHVLARYNRGYANFSLGRYEEALEDYDGAIDLDPNYAWAYNNRGYTKLFLGRHEEAIEDFERAIALDPDTGVFQQNLEMAIARGTASVQPPPSCLCNTVGQTGHSSASDYSLLSLLIMMFD